MLEIRHESRARAVGAFGKERSGFEHPSCDMNFNNL